MCQVTLRNLPKKSQKSLILYKVCDIIFKVKNRHIEISL